MFNRVTKTISILLAVILMTSVLPLAFSAGAASVGSAKKITAYNVGDMVTFGSYPQSKVKDESVIAALNALEADWQSYDYTSGDTTDWTWDNGSAVKSDYMQYCDVVLDGEQYRGVTFTAYRPYSDNFPSATTSNYSYQAINGYQINTVYWFKYEPLTWRVLDPATGLVLCQMVIDSQPYSDTMYWIDLNGNGERELETEYFKDAEGTIYANNYAESSIRAFLNDMFYNTAFDRIEKAQILGKTRDNKAARPEYAAFDSASTTDKVTLISNDDLLNEDYGFTSVWGACEYFSRTTGTDYALAQGLYKSSYLSFDGKLTVDWWLRSAGDKSRNACYVWHGGSSRLNVTASYTSVGVRPAINLDLNALIAPDDYPVPVSIAINNAKTDYKYKETLLLSDLTVNLTFSDGSVRRVLFGFSVDGYDPAKVGTQTLTVKLLNLTTEYNVTVSYTLWQKIIRYCFFGWLWY